jgi:hypothetical protein
VAAVGINPKIMNLRALALNFARPVIRELNVMIKGQPDKLANSRINYIKEL